MSVQKTDLLSIEDEELFYKVKHFVDNSLSYKIVIPKTFTRYQRAIRIANTFLTGIDNSSILQGILDGMLLSKFNACLGCALVDDDHQFGTRYRMSLEEDNDFISLLFSPLEKR